MLPRPRRRIPYRHAYLLVALVAMVFARPFMHSSDVGLSLLDLLLVLTLGGAVSVSTRSRVSFLVTIGTALLVIASRILSATEEPPGPWTTVFLASMIAFNLGFALLTLWNILKPGRRVTTDTMLGAVSAYLLIGVAWACAFALLQLHEPGSFDLGTRSETESATQFWTYLGFSYTTLTTLGYGNIAPLTSKADALSTSEAIIGQFYVAILVGRLVALQLSHQRREDREQPPGS